MITKRTMLGATLMAGLASALPSIAQVAPERATVVYGGSSWLGHYPVWVGIKKDMFKKRGLGVLWQSFVGSSGRMGSMVAGDLDIAGTGVVSALALMAAGNKSFSIVATPDSYATVEGILANDSIKSVADLKGKKIGVTFASSAHVLVLDILNQAKIDPNKDVTLLNMPVSEMPAAMQGRQVDAVAAWTPAFNKVKALPGMKVLVDDREFSLYKRFGVGPGPDVITVRNEFRDKYPRTTAAFIDGMFEAIVFMRDKPDEAAAVLMELTNLTRDEQKSVLADVQWHDRAEQQKLLLGDKPFIVGVELLGKFLVDNKQLMRAPAAAEWFDTRLVQAAK